jgi:hypothetical protein
MIVNNSQDATTTLLSVMDLCIICHEHTHALISIPRVPLSVMNAHIDLYSQGTTCMNTYIDLYSQGTIVCHERTH